LHIIKSKLTKSRTDGKFKCKTTNPVFIIASDIDYNESDNIEYYS
jgi:hypothetical protein